MKTAYIYVKEESSSYVLTIECRKKKSLSASKRKWTERCVEFNVKNMLIVPCSNLEFQFISPHIHSLFVWYDESVNMARKYRQEWGCWCEGIFSHFYSRMAWYVVTLRLFLLPLLSRWIRAYKVMKFQCVMYENLMIPLFEV